MTHFACGRNHTICPALCIKRTMMRAFVSAVVAGVIVCGAFGELNRARAAGVPYESIRAPRFIVEREVSHPLLGIQVLLALGLILGGTYLVIDTIRDSSGAWPLTPDNRIGLGGLCVFIGAVVASFALIPL